MCYDFLVCFKPNACWCRYSTFQLCKGRLKRMLSDGLYLFCFFFALRPRVGFIVDFRQMVKVELGVNLGGG